MRYLKKENNTKVRKLLKKKIKDATKKVKSLLEVWE